MSDQESDPGRGGDATGNSKTFVVLVIVVLIVLAFILYVGGFTKGRESTDEADVETAVWVGESAFG